MLPFRELAAPIGGYHQFTRMKRWHVETVDGNEYLGLDTSARWFIDRTCTFSFRTANEALNAARSYYLSHGLVYPYVLGRDDTFTRTDGFTVPKTVDGTQSQVMEFV